MERIAVLGGDERMRLLARMLKREDREVTDRPTFSALPVEAAAADRVVLPVPLERGGKLSGTDVPLGELWKVCRPGQRLYAGAVSAEAREAAQALHLSLTDYLEREELAVRNAVPTAEGAIAAAMARLPVTLRGTRCLVLGFGRIGKLLAQDLHALGACVSVAARRIEDLAWIDAFGYTPLPIRQMRGKLGSFRVIFNTVPQRVLDGDALREVRKDCLLLELASRGGFDMETAETLGIETVKASGLPGKYAPESAAYAIRQTLERIWEEEKQ